MYTHTLFNAHTLRRDGVAFSVDSILVQVGRREPRGGGGGGGSFEWSGL